VAAQTHGFVSVHRLLAGSYCLAAASGISPASTAPAVSVESSRTTATGLPSVAVNAQPTPPCLPGEFAVQTSNAAINAGAPTSLAPPTPSNAVAFTIVVP
jgi:hypothetical protein